MPSGVTGAAISAAGLGSVRILGCKFVAALAMRDIAYPAPRLASLMFAARENFKMIEVATAPVFAPMMQLKTLGNRPIRQLIGQVMRLADFALVADAPIAAARRAPPNDAL